jgi:uncharacterized protein YqjF (DUF2071 family)
MHPALARQDHRPWPIPADEWSWRQSWCDLLFAHWPVPAELIRPLVPEPLQVQEFDGSAWIGIVPFRMEGVMRRPLPDMPWISAFPELNVRTYVEHGGRPGVWFLSLDATSALAVWVGRRFFHLPYHCAPMSIETNAGQRFGYSHRRPESHVMFEATYGPAGEIHQAEAGTLEHFLTERYCLYARRPDGAVLRADVHHEPWPLQAAEIEIRANTMTDSWNIALSDAPALVHFARRVDVVVWAPQRL